MKRAFLKIFALSLSAILALSLFSCGKKDINDGETDDDTTNAETTIKIGDPISVPLADTVTYADSNGESVPLDKNSIVICTVDGNCKISKTDNTEVAALQNITLPYGIKCGDSFESVCKNAKIENGYAIYGENGKVPEMFTENALKAFDGTKEITLIFGYKVVDGNCIAVDAEMLQYVLSGVVVSNYDFDTVLFSLAFDKDAKLIYSCEIYSEYAVFRDIMK